MDSTLPKSHKTFDSEERAFLCETLSALGARLANEQDPVMQQRLGADLVRLGQRAVDHHCYVAVQAAWSAISAVEQKLPSLGSRLRPCVNVHGQLPEMIAEAVSLPLLPADLLEVLRAVPHASAELLAQELGASGQRERSERIILMARQLGPHALQHLRNLFLHGSHPQSALTVGLLSRLDAQLIERALPQQLQQWQRGEQERALRQLSSAASPQLPRLLLKLMEVAPPQLLPWMIDELSFTAAREHGVGGKLMELAFTELEGENAGYVRVKAMEALGRLRESAAEGHFMQVIAARERLHWKHPRELRVTAAQALLMLTAASASGIAGDIMEFAPLAYSEDTLSFLEHKGFSEHELALGPLPPSPQSRWVRQRRYARIAQPQAARIAGESLAADLRVEQLSLGGGLASVPGEAPCGSASLQLGAGMGRVHAGVWLRPERDNKCSFEIVSMGLEDRSRLRRMLTGGRMSLPAMLFDRQNIGLLRMTLQ